MRVSETAHLKDYFHLVSPTNFRSRLAIGVRLQCSSTSTAQCCLFVIALHFKATWGPGRRRQPPFAEGSEISPCRSLPLVHSGRQNDRRSAKKALGSNWDKRMAYGLGNTSALGACL